MGSCQGALVGLVWFRAVCGPQPPTPPPLYTSDAAYDLHAVGLGVRGSIKKKNKTKKKRVTRKNETRNAIHLRIHVKAYSE